MATLKYKIHNIDTKYYNKKKTFRISGFQTFRTLTFRTQEFRT